MNLLAVALTVTVIALAVLDPGAVLLPRHVVSTIWRRYHYAVDVIAGMITGTLGYVIGNRIMKRRAAVAPVPEKGHI